MILRGCFESDCKNQTLDKSVEWLTYEFMDQTDSSAMVALSWEKRMIRFKISADIKRLQIEEFKKDFQTTRPADDFIQGPHFAWLIIMN